MRSKEEKKQKKKKGKRKWTKEFHQQYCRDWYWKNKRKRQEYNREWKKENPTWMHDWYIRNRESRMKKHQKWNLSNKDRQRVYKRRRRESWKQFCETLGLTSCSICGYSKCWRALDFHHTDPTKKTVKIAYLMSLSLTSKNKERFLEELKNMILLCGNCHREQQALEEDKMDTIVFAMIGEGI